MIKYRTVRLLWATEQWRRFHT